MNQKPSLRHLFESLDPEKRSEWNNIVLDNTEQEYKDFKANFDKGRCYLCNQGLESYEAEHPCLHWLLRRNTQMKKKKILRMLASYDMFQALSYTRWLASTTGSLLHINEQEDEMEEGEYFHQTVKFENFTWTFLVKNTDLTGHSSRGSIASRQPHYHLEMLVDGQCLISFSDYHLPLSDDDVFAMELRKGDHPEGMMVFPFAESYRDMETILDPETLLSSLKTSNVEDGATYHVSTFVEADKGHTIKGDDIAALAKRSHETGVPMAQLLKELKNTKVTVITSPVDGLVDKRHRK